MFVRFKIILKLCLEYNKKEPSEYYTDLGNSTKNLMRFWKDYCHLPVVVCDKSNEN